MKFFFSFLARITWLIFQIACFVHPQNLAQSRMEVTKLTTDVELLCREKVDLREEIEAHKLTVRSRVSFN